MKGTKDNIFEAAIKVFSKSGYDSATMDEVAREAGVAKGTLYYHFSSKEALFYFVVERGIDLIKSDIQNVVKSVQEPVEKIKVISRFQLECVYENKDLFRVIVSHLWGKENQHEEIREQIKDLIKMNSLFLENGDAPLAKNEEDAEMFGYYLVGILFSSVLYEIINGEQSNSGKAVEKFIDYIGNGLNLRIE